MESNNPFRAARQKVDGNEKPEKPEEIKTPVAPEQEPKSEIPQGDILAGLKSKKPMAKTYGFYLDDDVVVAIEKIAKQTRTSKSKVLNTILRNTLLNGGEAK